MQRNHLKIFQSHAVQLCSVVFQMLSWSVEEMKIHSEIFTVFADIVVREVKILHLLSVNDIDTDEYDRPSATDLFLGATKLYIVVGCVAALLALALLQASCTLYRSSKRRATKVCPVRVRNFLFLLTYFFSLHFFSHPQVCLLSVVFCSFSNELVIIPNVSQERYTIGVLSPPKIALFRNSFISNYQLNK